MAASNMRDMNLIGSALVSLTDAGPQMRMENSGTMPTGRWTSDAHGAHCHKATHT